MVNKKKSPTPTQVLDFENRLQSSLKPVDPDNAFVDRLRYRLVTPAEMELEQHSPAVRAASALLLSFVIISIALAIGLALLRILALFKGTASARA